FGFQSRSGTNKSGEIVAPKFETFVEWWIPEDPAHRAYGPNLVCALDQGVARYVEIPVGPKTPFRGLACILCDDESKSITVPPGTDQVIWGRLQYPIREVEGNRMPIDPGKSLLYFLMMMNQLLTMRHIKPDIELHEHYIKGGLRSTIIVER
ncbi:MAG TPA: hypothetical protein PLA94_16070, partial [Myxococcota bacterium]|nr:hypothetical protein [Myxococcota bacterium]